MPNLTRLRRRRRHFRQQIPGYCIVGGRKCRKEYPNVAGWDFLAMGSICGWICPPDRRRVREALKGKGLPPPVAQ